MTTIEEFAKARLKEVDSERRKLLKILGGSPKSPVVGNGRRKRSGWTPARRAAMAKRMKEFHKKKKVSE